MNAAKKIARFVNEMGTGLMGIGIEFGPAIQNSAAISPTITILKVFVLFINFPP